MSLAAGTGTFPDQSRLQIRRYPQTPSFTVSRASCYSRLGKSDVAPSDVSRRRCHPLEVTVSPLFFAAPRCRLNLAMCGETSSRAGGLEAARCSVEALD
jgi:hypothetical protein